MGTLEDIITAITLFFGYLSLLFLYYLMMFLGWLNSNQEMLLAQFKVVVVLALLTGVFSLLRWWIKAQLVIQKTSVDEKNVPETLIKDKHYGCLFLGFFLLMESIYAGGVTYGRLQIINSMAAGNFSEDLIGVKPDLWIFIPLIAQIVLVVHAAFSLFEQKSAAVLSLGVAMTVSFIGVAYHFNNDIQYISGALIYITIARVLPLAYTIFLLRNGKLY